MSTVLANIIFDPPNRIYRHQLEPGDHIYTWRSGYVYAHHGIYIGDGMVIHFMGGAGSVSSLSSVFSVSSVSSSRRCCAQNGPGVIKTCLDCFLEDGHACLYKYGVSSTFFREARGGTCTMDESDPPDQVLQRALSLLQNNGFGTYDVLTNNCEDFANYCKTGKKNFVSGQVESVATGGIGCNIL